MTSAGFGRRRNGIGGQRPQRADVGQQQLGEKLAAVEDRVQQRAPLPLRRHDAPQLQEPRPPRLRALRHGRALLAQRSAWARENLLLLSSMIWNDARASGGRSWLIRLCWWCSKMKNARRPRWCATHVLQLIVGPFLIEHGALLGRPLVDLVRGVERLAAPVEHVGAEALVGRAAPFVVGGDRPLLRPERRHLGHEVVEQVEGEGDRPPPGAAQRPTRCARGQTSSAEPIAKRTAKTISAVEKSSDGGQGRPRRALHVVVGEEPEEPLGGVLARPSDRA